MKAISFYTSISRYILAQLAGKQYPTQLLPLRLTNMATPEPPPGWIRVKVRLCGICKSDIALIYGKSSPRISPFFSFPSVLGHEILGEVDGERVVINPLLACRERGTPTCLACNRGEDELCENVAEGIFSAGMLGFCSDLPGGWGEWIIAHPNRIHHISEKVADDHAVLVEPLSVVLRGLRFLSLNEKHTILIIGAGSIGLLTVVALRLLGVRCAIHVAAKRQHQAALAKELGADRVHSSAWEAARSIGAKLYAPLIGPMAYRSGFSVVVDAAGSKTSLEQAVWTVREGGQVLLLGAPGIVRHDFSPHWFRAIQFFGSYTYSQTDFCQASELLTGVKLGRIVTHTFSLNNWKTAIRTATRGEGIKIAFKP